MRQKVRALSPRAPKVVHSAGEGACCSVVISDWVMPGGGSVRLDLMAHIGGATVRVATAFVSQLVGARLAILVSGVPAEGWTVEAWAQNPRGEFGLSLDVRGCCAERAVWVEPDFWVAPPDVPAAMRANSAAPARVRDGQTGTGGPAVVSVPRGASIVLASLTGPGSIQFGAAPAAPVAANEAYSEVYAPLELVGPLDVTIAGAGAGDWSIVWLVNA